MIFNTSRVGGPQKKVLLLRKHIPQQVTIRMNT